MSRTGRVSGPEVGQVNSHVFSFCGNEGKDAPIEELHKQINDIVQDLNITKEQQALKSGEIHTDCDYIHQHIGPDELIWLGISDMVTESKWMDQAGNSILYKNWDSVFGDLESNSSQNCAILSEATGGKWLDKNRHEEKASVCEFNII
uniref:C-type lectin domain-containing protein n=1 Tax=Hucho hucho TaxID=62062 RepID=A0A4W5MZU5_9TELE